MTNVRYFLLVCFTAVVSWTKADVRLPYIFGSGMVLQRGIEIPVWGQADSGERITLVFHGQTRRAKAGHDGSWSVKFDPVEAGGPYEMTIEGKNEITFSNVMTGDVWICSGQSNMEFSVSRGNDAEQEIAVADYPDIRLLTVPNSISSKPEKNTGPAEWKICTPENIPSFSAVGYFFGRKLNHDLKVPVGLINTNWGGTVIESWTSPDAMESDEDFSAALEELRGMDMREVNEDIRKKFEQWHQNLQNMDAGSHNGEYSWAMADTDYSAWQTMKLPALWEDNGHQGMDGVMWFSLTVELPAEIARMGAELNLGMIDDSDMTWVNGHLAGRVFNHYNWNRKYDLSPDVLHAGINTIVVRVEDYGGGGGIYGDPGQLYIRSGKFRKSLAGEWKYRIGTGKLPGPQPQTTFGPNSYPTLLYNAMIHPLVPFGIRGAIWYQGEANAGRAYQYRRLFPLMIRDWRNQWKQGDFPFLFVQLANFMAAKDLPSESEWAELREAQTMTLSLPNTGMASAIDIGDADDIHPKNKQEVGRRLALNALKISYGREVVYSGPMYESMRVDGNRAYIRFSHTGSGLKVHDPYGYVKGFTVAGSDHNFYWARAEKVDDNTVVVYAKEVSEPVAVRFGWADNPADLNLYNVEGLPANPFRTDEWDGLTSGGR